METHSYELLPPLLHSLLIIKTNLAINHLLLETLILIVLLFLSGLFSGSEVAYFSLSPKQLSNIKKDTSGKSKMIIQHLKEPKQLLGALLIANNFVNVGIVILSAFIINELFDFSQSPILGFGIQIVGITFILLLFGEILPKVYATQKPQSFAKAMAFPIKYTTRIFYPFIKLLILSTRLIDKRLEKKPHNISINELSHALDLTSGDKDMIEEKKILKGIVEFGNIDVKEIMTSRMDVVAIEKQTPFNHICNTILDAGYSRIPVYTESFDRIDGILYIKDLLPFLRKKENSDWAKLIRPAFFVPESKKINDLLQEFQEKKIHMAIVVDEYGGSSGIITLEDIIEEIVGEINDEFDQDEIVYSKVDENQYIFEAKTSIIDFAKVFNLDPEIFEKNKGESDSLAGLILEIEGKIPEKNTIVQFQDFEFKIESVDNRRIKRIRVTLKKDQS